MLFTAQNSHKQLAENKNILVKKFSAVSRVEYFKEDFIFSQMSWRCSERVERIRWKSTGTKHGRYGTVHVRDCTVITFKYFKNP